MPIVLRNMACYLDCLPMDAGLGAILAQLEALFRRLALQLHSMDGVTPLLRIMISVLRIQGVASYKVSYNAPMHLQAVISDLK